MRRREDRRSLGQILYESLASGDKTSHHWREWCELSPDEKTSYENLVPQIRQKWQEELEDEEDN